MSERQPTRPMPSEPSLEGERPESPDAELERLRRAIDAVDAAILERLNERARLVLQVGELKQRAGSPVYVAGRERAIVERLTTTNPGPFPDAGLAPVFREIISATRSLEAPVRIAYLGPEGTFSHQAARLQFGARAEYRGVGSIREILAAVERGLADFGVLPLENTTEGVVTQTLDALAESQLSICGELRLRISQQLLSRSGRFEDVERVASHPQPLAQCRRWLERHLPSAERVETASTAAAARLAAEDGRVAAIASALSAEVYGLEIVERAIEDRRDNTTRFAVVGQESPPVSGRDMTSAVFTVRKDASGTLYRLLEPFARHGVNLTSIQCRPIAGKPWEYHFFLDLEGHRSEPPVAKALAEAAERAYSSRVIGSYPSPPARPGEA